MPIILVAIATIVFIPGRAYFNTGQWALFYLLIVVFMANLSGVWPAILVSILSFLMWNYFFLPPYYTLLIDNPKDWLALLTFLVVGVLMGLQTGRLKERENQALARERETELLYQFSAQLVSEMNAVELARVLAEK
ncbi:MAG: DUF4118 domain-containing protein, partial [Candidatus Margulisiibacteriota bacterium]